MVLTEWNTSEKQHQLLSLLQKDGAGIPNNIVFDTAIRYTIEQRYPVSRMRYFSTDTDLCATPTYAFILEEDTFSSFYVRPPPAGHERDLLHLSLKQLFDKFTSRLDKGEEMLMLSDGVTTDVLHNVLSTDLPSFIACTPCPVELFYMTDEQIQLAKQTNLPSIHGFQADSVNVERDAMTIHDNWVHSTSLQSTTARLRHVPASIVRDATTGDACAWMMSSPYGQCSNLFTIPAYRGKGLARLAEMHLIKQFIGEGLRPFKYIDVDNTEAVAAARRNSLWTQWEKRKESMDGLEATIHSSPLFYTTINTKD